MWRKANRRACITGAVVGLVCALVGWLVTTATLNNGVIDLETTLQDYPMLCGNVLAIGMSYALVLPIFTVIDPFLTFSPRRSGIISYVGSMIWPEDYSFEETRLLHAVNEATEETVPSPGTPSGDEKEKSDVVAAAATELTAEHEQNEEDSPAQLQKSYRLAKWIAISSFIVLMILYATLFPPFSLDLIVPVLSIRRQQIEYRQLTFSFFSSVLSFPPSASLSRSAAPATSQRRLASQLVRSRHLPSSSIAANSLQTTVFSPSPAPSSSWPYVHHTQTSSSPLSGCSVRPYPPFLATRVQASLTLLFFFLCRRSFCRRPVPHLGVPPVNR
jgi:hypothetical protein